MVIGIKKGQLVIKSGQLACLFTIIIAYFTYDYYYGTCYYYTMFTTVLYAGLALLGTWAIVNIAMWYRRRSYPKTVARYYFWQMNALWNSVNLAIALISIGIVTAFYSKYTADAGLQELQIKIIAVNILLDFVYIIVGLLLENKGKRKEDVRFMGYGDAIQLQGAFLFCFDSIFALALIITTL